MKTNPSNEQKTQLSPNTSSASRSAPYNRRAFVKRALAAGAAANLASLAWSSANGSPARCGGQPCNPNQRRMQAFQIRLNAAQTEMQQPLPDHPDNGDEARYPKKIGNYSKGLPHNDLGEVDLNAYGLYLRALASGDPDDFERIPMGCPDPANRFKLVDPQAGLAFDLEGVDSHATFQPPAPAFASAQESGEILELYWMALTRDIPFSEYDTNPLTQAAAADLSNLSDFRGTALCLIALGVVSAAALVLLMWREHRSSVALSEPTGRFAIGRTTFVLSNGADHDRNMPDSLSGEARTSG